MLRPRYRKNDSVGVAAGPLLDLRGRPIQAAPRSGPAMREIAAILLQLVVGHAAPRPRQRAAPAAAASTWATWVLVAATPISRPARVKSTPSASRVAWQPMMLVSASTGAPASRARRIAARVSAVSPDWVMAITRARGRAPGCGSGTRWPGRPPPACAPSCSIAYGRSGRHETRCRRRR